MRLFEYASAGETLLNALIVMTITFIVLIALFGLVRAFTFVFSFFTKGQQPETDESIESALVKAPGLQLAGGEFSAGTLSLRDVDETTAAMIMAIVSDKTDVPLERLIFRSIKLVK